MAQDNVQTKILEIEVNYSEAIEKIAQYRIEIEKIKERQKELKTALKEGRISQEEYHKSMESSKLAMQQLSSASSVLTKQVKSQMKAQQEAEGSLTQLRSKLSTLTSEYDRMSKAERDSAKGNDLRDKINEVTTALKDAEESTQRYYRNVGNYEGATKSLKQQFRELRAELQQMIVDGKQNTPEFQDLVEKAGALKDQMADLSQAINNVASDTGQLDSLKEGLQGVVSTYSIFKMAAGENAKGFETLDKIMQGMTATLAVVNALQTVQNALQHQSALMRGVNAVKTWALNTALGAQATATTAVATAEGGATAATIAWNAALYANPIVWLVGIIAVAVAAIYGLIKAFEWFTSDSEKRKQALAEEAEALEELHRLNEQALEMASARGMTDEERSRRTIENLKAESDAWARHFEKIKEEYDEDDDEYKEALESKRKAHDDFIASLDDALISLTKVQTEQREYERKEALGEYEYKRTLIREQTKQQIELAKTLLKYNKITKAEYDALVADLNKLQTRKIGEVDKEETEAAKKAADAKKKAASDAAKSAADAAKKRQEAAKKAEEEYYKEVEKAQDALLALVKDGLDKQLQAENLSYERGLKALQDKLAKYQTNSEYDVKMRQALNDQIYALTTAHERKVAEFQYSEAQRQIKIQQELIQAKLENIKKGTLEELQLRMAGLGEQEEADQKALDKRLADGELTQEQYNALRLTMEESYRRQKLELAEQYDQLDLDRQKAALQAEIDAMQYAEDERQLKVREGYEMSDQAYAEWRERGLAGLEEHERNLLLKQEEAAAAELAALQARGQLSTQTTEEYEAEVLAAKKKSQQAQAATNQAIIKDEQAKAQAMKSVTSSLTGLLDTLGESNKTFAKMSKIITLAQIAIDTGKALASGIASASSMPFPANLAAIATTVATILANVTTAITTVKSAKFAEGGKVNGPGTGTSDSIPAYLSNGEFVMTAQATRMFEPLLVAMNGIGKGVPMPSRAASERVTTAEMMTESFGSAAREIRPVVSVVEINEVQDRVNVIENLDTFD